MYYFYSSAPDNYNIDRRHGMDNSRQSNDGGQILIFREKK